MCDESFAHFVVRLSKDRMFLAAFCIGVIATGTGLALVAAIALMTVKQPWYEQEYEDWDFDVNRRWAQPASASHGPKWLPTLLYIVLTLCLCALFFMWTHYFIHFDAKSAIKFGYALESTTSTFFFLALFIGGIVLWREVLTAY